jgi:hypothetical protein
MQEAANGVVLVVGRSVGSNPAAFAREPTWVIALSVACFLKLIRYRLLGNAVRKDCLPTTY